VPFRFTALVLVNHRLALLYGCIHVENAFVNAYVDVLHQAKVPAVPNPLTDPNGLVSKSSYNKVIGFDGYIKLIGVPEPIQIEAAVGVVVPAGGGVLTT
jgi:hypothetical protein